MFPAIDRRPAPRCLISRGPEIPRGPEISYGPERCAPGGGANHPGGLGSLRRRALEAARPRRVARALFGLCGAAAILIGCPLYSDECDSRNDCASGFSCDEFSRQCTPNPREIGCTRPSQCEVGETCTPDFVCRPGSCDYHGCVRGYRCGVVDFAHTCVSGGEADASLPPPTDAGGVDGGVDVDLDAGTDAGDASLDASP